ncbi:hypothetical protein GCM10023084_37100 [Streptomyces lacrimifluminis]|uniref:Uncharacterized protein n=1 Tax=Streptomyces lacrimifluminis TaxID=1500077 RepID=A0A917L182_9ACTN|nr:hypothetical protein [Streptomyces lacrimifluminis]GGJ36742.1 hypothetical protein GCM10012282_36850 [Streptomyces lacrimifluminis]
MTTLDLAPDGADIRADAPDEAALRPVAAAVDPWTSWSIDAAGIVGPDGPRTGPSPEERKGVTSSM